MIFSFYLFSIINKYLLFINNIILKIDILVKSFRLDQDEKKPFQEEGFD